MNLFNISRPTGGRTFSKFFGALCLLILFGPQAYSQVTLFADSVTGTNGSQVTVPIRANDFTNLIGMQGSIAWDTALVQYDTTFQFGLPSMNVANFGVAQVNNGRLTFSWDDPTFLGVSVADSSVLFSVRFLVTGNPGDQSPIVFQNSPTQLEFTNNSFQVVPNSTINGEVEVQLGASCAILGISTGAQSNCDPQTNTYSQDLTVNYGNPPGTGTLLVNGQSFPITGSPQTITLSGLISDGNPVNAAASFSADPGCSRVVNNLFNAPSPCAVFEIYADSVVGSVGGTVSVPVRANNFVNLIGAQGSIHWNTAVVSFDTLSAFGLPSMGIANFGITQTANGILTFSWDDPTFIGVSVADSTVLFQLDFDVVGIPGDQTPIELLNSPTSLEFIDNGFNPVAFSTANGEVDLPLGSSCGVLALAPGNQTVCNPQTNRYTQEVTVTYANAPSTGSLEVNGQSFPIATSPQTVTLTNLFSDGQPVNVVASFSANAACSKTEVGLFNAPAPCGQFQLFADSFQGATGSQVIVPIRVRNFVDLIGLQGSIDWNTTVADLDTVVQLGLPGLNVSNFGYSQTGSGKLTFSWDDPTFNGVNVTDSTVIFALRFDVVGGPGSVTPVAFSSVPTQIEVTNNNFITIGFDTLAGEIEVPIVSCAITDLAAGSQSVCNPFTNTYSQQVIVTYTTAPSTGGLLVNGQAFPIGSSPQTVNLTGLSSNGLPTDVTASFSADTTCFRVENALFNAPFPCISPNVTLFADSVISPSGSQIIVPVRVRNFSDLIGMQGTVAWNTSIATYDTVVQFGLPSMTVANFGTALVNTGLLTFSWDDPTLAGVSVADSTIVFGIRFNVVGSAGTQTPIQFVDAPTFLEFTDNSFQTVPFDTIPGEIEIPLVGLLTGNLPGSFFCVGDTVQVPFSFTGIFNASNVFSAELSDANGSFAAPTVIGTLNGATGIAVTSVIPAVPSGTGYRIRVTASDPVTIGSDNGTDFEISNIQVAAAAAICDGDSVFLGGAFQSMAGVFTDTLTAGNGCDSIVTTTLTVFPVFSTFDTVQICAGDSFLVGGAFQTATGSYLDTLGSANGCDSVVTTQLEVIPSINTNLTASICAGDSILLAGQFQTLAGTYVDSLTASGGCDSLVSTVLTVLPLSFDTVQVTICDGDSIFLGGGFQTIGGNYLDTLLAGNGCDSLLTTVLTVAPNFATNASIQICQGDSILLGGAFQFVSGSYVDTLVSMDGCDSVVTTALSVVATIQAVDTVEICDGDSVLLAGAFQQTSGNYVDTLASNAGCDSVVTTTLIVNPNYAVNDTVDICQGDSILLAGSFQTAAGSYVDTLISVSGCDSVVTTQLNVIPTVFTNLSTDICNGDSILLGGAFQTTAGTYIDSLTAATGCDSIVSTTLTILPVSFNSVSVSFCDGDSVFAGGGFQTLAGSYVDTLVAANGCDSILTTVITILPTFAVTDTIQICDGDSVFLAGAFQTVSGNYVDSLLTTAGCDSILTTTLDVIPTIFSFDTLNICDGDSAFLGGSFQQNSGDFSDTLVSSLGCDSILTTTLVVNPNFNIIDSAQICQGDSILLGGAFQTAAGSYIDTLVSAAGCDSVVTTNLTVLSILFGSDSVAVCDGDSVFLAGAFQTVSGSYVDTLVSAFGCDSVLTTVLEVLLPTASNPTVNICDGDSILLGGSFQTVSGTFVDTLVGSNGCDSVVTTQLVVLPNAAASQSLTICDGDSILLAGAFQTTSGVYIDTLVATNGCDSVLTSNLTVLPNSAETVQVNICDGDSLFLGGDFQTVSGSYLDTLVAANGCDSILTSILTVFPTFATNDTVEICDGDSILLGGSFTTVPGTYIDTLVSVNGCDSIVTSQLIVNPTFFASVNDTICQGDLYVLPGGDTATVSGTYQDTLLTAAGCDSIFVTNLVVNPTFNLTQSPSICQGDSFALPTGTFVGTAGIYVDTLLTSLGCDSIITTNLTVNPVFNQSQSIDLCDGDTLILPGGGTTDSAGVYTDTLSTGAGCDSIIVTTVSILPTFQVAQAVSICDGDSLILPGGASISQAGVYVDTLQSGLGCDSVVTTTVSIDPTFAVAVADTICDGDTYTLPGGSQVTTAGVYQDTLATQQGCDSIITTTLVVNPSFNQTVSVDICQGDSLVLPGGSVVNTAGTYVDTLATGLGCDSIITTNLTVNPIFNQSVSASICDGDTFTLPGGAMVTTAGTYSDTLSSSLGCDSIIVTSLTLNPTYAVSILDIICQGDNYILPGGDTALVSGTYVDTLQSIDGCDSVITTTLMVNPSYNFALTADICDGDSVVLPGGGVATTAGVYTDSLVTSLGCDSVYVTTVTVNTAFNQTVTASICDGDSYTLPGGSQVTAAGVYTDSLSTVNGCDSVIVTTLTVNQTFSVPVTASICDNETYTLPGGSSVSVAGVYNDTLTTSAGCDSVIVTTLTVNPTSFAQVSDSFCDGTTYTLPGGGVATMAGVYTDTLASGSGCDSIIETTLSVTVIDTSITLLNGTLTANQNGASYQWVDCGAGGVPIPGATGQSYTPTVDGSYSVTITLGSCSATSSCISVVVIGIGEADISSDLTVFPNPSSGEFNLDFGQRFSKVEVWVTDARGRSVYTNKAKGVTEMAIELDEVAEGMYFIGVRADGHLGGIRVIVRR